MQKQDKDYLMFCFLKGRCSHIQTASRLTDSSSGRDLCETQIFVVLFPWEGEELKKMSNTLKSLIENSLRKKKRKFTGLFRLYNKFSLHVPLLRSSYTSAAFKCVTGCPLLRLLDTINVLYTSNFKYIRE